LVEQLIYISTAPDLLREQVQDILSVCAQNNEALGVTGLLLYNGRNFLQLLEGEGAVLAELMAKIEVDPRHAGVTTLYRKDVAERACPNWSMRLIEIAADRAARREQVGQDLPRSLDTEARKLALNFAVLN
jgi:hypothetical protein